MRRMTALELYAHHGSTSYGSLTTERLRQILEGDTPNRDEIARVGQAFDEIPGAIAFDLAVEMGISYERLNGRVKEIIGHGVPAG